MNVAELSIEHLERFGEYRTMWFEGRWFTNKEMLERGARVAHGLRELGVKRGDRVATVLGNCPEVLNVFNACFQNGAWCMPVLFTLTGPEMGNLFEDAQPEVVVTEKAFLDKVTEGKKRTASIKAVVTIDDEPQPGCVYMKDWLDEMPSAFDMVSCDPDDVAMLMYTSGTTGKPKGVMLTHDNLHFTALASARGQGTEEGEVGISVLPLNHSYGIITSIAGTQYRNSGVLMRWFNPEEMLKLIAEFKANITALVPTMILYLLALPDVEKYDLSSMRRWGCAAAPLAAEVKRKFEERFPGEIFEGYGLTECSPTVFLNRRDLPYREGSVGKPIDGVEVCIKDNEGGLLGPGEPGEICVRGRNVMKGYYNRPEATAEVIRDGWLHTGDVGCMDEDGYLYVTDRVKDLIIRGGENVFPKDIEEVLMRHPKVAEAAVIGMPDEYYGEEVMAVVVPAPDAEPTAEEIIEFCSEHLGKFQVPKRIEFTPMLPKNLVGKILKKEIRAQYFG